MVRDYISPFNIPLNTGGLRCCGVAVHRDNGKFRSILRERAASFSWCSTNCPSFRSGVTTGQCAWTKLAQYHKLPASYTNKCCSALPRHKSRRTCWHRAIDSTCTLRDKRSALHSRYISTPNESARVMQDRYSHPFQKYSFRNTNNSAGCFAFTSVRQASGGSSPKLPIVQVTILRWPRVCQQRAWWSQNICRGSGNARGFVPWKRAPVQLDLPAKAADLLRAAANYGRRHWLVGGGGQSTTSDSLTSGWGRSTNHFHGSANYGGFGWFGRGPGGRSAWQLGMNYFTNHGTGVGYHKLWGSENREDVLTDTDFCDLRSAMQLVMPHPTKPISLLCTANKIYSCPERQSVTGQVFVGFLIIFSILINLSLVLYTRKG